jgi:hypothetical protein
MRSPLLTLAILGTAVVAQAQIAAVSNRFAYTGSVTRYETLADAQAGLNATGTSTLPENRDLRLYLTKGFELFALPDATEIATAWHFSTVSGSAGAGNPSNVLPGFVQIPNHPATSAASAHWDSSLTTFTLGIHGSNTAPAGSPRLWNGTDSAGQFGEFLQYDFTLIASGLAPAFWVPIANTYASVSEPTAVTGRFNGLFRNTSAETGASGFYTFDFELNLDSWVYANRDGLFPLDDPRYSNDSFYSTSVFAAPTAVPEPTTYGLLGAGMLLVLALVRRFHLNRG